MSERDPILIEIQSPEVVQVDVSNKIVNISAIDIIDIIGYTPEDVANKTSTFQNVPDDIHYPTEKLVNDTFIELRADIHEQWDAFVTLDAPTVGDVLIHDGNNFKNRPKEEITDGGNW
jgi:hypothetical protein